MTPTDAPRSIEQVCAALKLSDEKGGGSDANAHTQSAQTAPDIAADWRRFAHKLAEWVDAHLVNARDHWGAYYRKAGATCLTTRKAIDEVGPKGKRRPRGPLTLDILRAHFGATETDGIVGLHSTFRDEAGGCWSRWFAVDVDAHDDDDKSDPAANLRAALAWYAALVALGFRPLLFDSNGNGGYHLIVIFNAPVPTARVYAFAQWLIRDWETYGLPSKPETFPKQARINPKDFGNWLRLEGHHHTNPHWSRLWSGSQWLDGEPAIVGILATEGDDPALIPPEAPASSSFDLADEIERKQAERHEAEPQIKPHPKPDNGVLPGDDFNSRADWATILEPHGWTLDHTDGGVRYWRRPGKATDKSASTNNTGNDTLHVFTDKTPFDQGGNYNKHTAYAILNHGRDFDAATRALSLKGFGTYSTWVKDGDGEWRRETRQNPCPKGVRIARPGEGPPILNGDGQHSAETTEAQTVIPAPSANSDGRQHQADDPPPAGESAPADDSTGDDEGIIDLWPKIAPEAFHGIAGELVRLASPHTEADPVAMLVQFLIAFANMLGRGPHFVVGATRHFLNLLAVFVGMTAQGRKGTSWDVSLFMIERIDPLWANDCIQSGLVSGEGLIHHVRDEVRGKPVRAKGKVLVTDGDIEVIDPGVTDKRLLIVETEFSRPLKSINRDTCTLSDVIRQAFDSGNLRNLSKNSPAKATGAHVSIIGHTTQTDIRKFLTATDSMNGFANRFLWVSARRSKILPDGGNMFSVDWAPLRNRLISVAEKAKQITKMGRDEDASQIWRDLYEDLSSPKPGILGAVLSRAEALVMRLACVYALLDGSAVVERPHLLAALAVWDYCESSARFIFGADLGNPKAEKLIEALKEAGDSGLSREQITVDVFQRNLKKEVIDVLLSDLLTLRAVHRLQVKSATGKGRPSVRWYRGMGAPDGSEAGTQ